MPNVFSIFINWTIPFSILGLLGGSFYFYSNFKSSFCKQTVENLIRCLVSRRLIWFCTVCRCPTKSTLGLYGLNELWKRYKMRGLLSILFLFHNEFNKFKNTGARMLDYIYHRTLNLLKKHFAIISAKLICSVTKSVNHQTVIV